MTVKKILVVEDESIIALDLKIRLQRMGYHISAIVATGEEAVRLASKIKPDLILMDILLKGKMNGIEAAQKIKKNNKIPVIFLTSFSDKNTYLSATMVSTSGYLIKPFNETDLKSRIELISNEIH